MKTQIKWVDLIIALNAAAVVVCADVGRWMWTCDPHKINELEMLLQGGSVRRGCVGCCTTPALDTRVTLLIHHTAHW